MLTRRRFVRDSALLSSVLATRPLHSAMAQSTAEGGRGPLRLAIIGSTYAYGSDLQNLADHFLVGYPCDGDWHKPNVQVVSMYVDARVRKADTALSGYQLAVAGRRLAPAGPTGSGHRRPQHAENAEATAESAPNMEDLSEARAHQFGFRLSPNIPDALRCGGDRLAVDAVLAVVEQDGYPLNDRGEVLLPTYDFFQQCVQVFQDEKRSVPYFNYKQLSFSFPEAKGMVETAARLKFPLMAGSALPVTWRLPDADLPMGAPVEEAVMVGVTLPGNAAFDALEALQSVLERRKGGESGVKAVQLLEGDDVWAAGKAGRWSRELLSSALSRSDTPQGLTLLDGRTQDLVASGVLPQLVKNPVAYCIEYSDGTRATMLMLDGAVQDFNIAVRTGDANHLYSTQFFMPPPPNNDWSAALAAKIEQMYGSRRVSWPVQRTLLTTGILAAGMNSRHRLNERLETPELAIRYESPAESQYARS